MTKDPPSPPENPQKEQHRKQAPQGARRWITEISDDLHPYLKEMIDESGALQ